MTFPADELDLLDAAFADVHALGVELLERDGWYPRLLVGILNATLREYQHLKAGLKHSTAMVAWACRGLLELHIYARYALASESNARRLTAERLNDGIEVFDAFQTWLARNDPQLVPSSVEEELRHLTEERADSEFAEAPPLKLKRLAAEVGLSDEYTNMVRLTEKLARPNGYAILDGDPEDLAPILFRAGAGHGLEIFRAVKVGQALPPAH